MYGIIKTLFCGLAATGLMIGTAGTADAQKGGGPRGGGGGGFRSGGIGGGSFKGGGMGGGSFKVNPSMSGGFKSQPFKQAGGQFKSQGFNNQLVKNQAPKFNHQVKNQPTKFNHQVKNQPQVKQNLGQNFKNHQVQNIKHQGGFPKHGNIKTQPFHHNTGKFNNFCGTPFGHHGKHWNWCGTGNWGYYPSFGNHCWPTNYCYPSYCWPTSHCYYPTTYCYPTSYCYPTTYCFSTYTPVCYTQQVYVPTVVQQVIPAAPVQEVTTTSVAQTTTTQQVGVAAAAPAGPVGPGPDMSFLTGSALGQ